MSKISELLSSPNVINVGKVFLSIAGVSAIALGVLSILAQKELFLSSTELRHIPLSASISSLTAGIIVLGLLYIYRKKSNPSQNSAVVNERSKDPKTSPDKSTSPTSVFSPSYKASQEEIELAAGICVQFLTKLRDEPKGEDTALSKIMTIEGLQYIFNVDKDSEYRRNGSQILNKMYENNTNYCLVIIQKQFPEQTSLHLGRLDRLLTARGRSVIRTLEDFLAINPQYLDKGRLAQHLPTKEEIVTAMQAKV